MLRFHHLDLEMKATTGEWSALPPNVARKLLVTDAGCWEWQGYRTGRGYGQVAINGKERWTVHRLVYTRLVGPVAEGLELDHLCRNRACANPSHLEAVTHAENVRRGDSPSAIAWRKRREEHADVA